MIIVVATIVLIGIDQWLKRWFLYHQTDSVIVNPGLAFNNDYLFLIWVGLVAFGFAVFLMKDRPYPMLLSLSIAVASNMIDRFTVRGVIDYIPLWVYRVNIADILICGLVVALTYHVLTRKES